MPVEIRRAIVHTAAFSVPAAAAQAVIDYSGLRVCEHRRGAAVVNLMLAQYLDGDLGPYNEFGVAVMVTPPDAPPGTPATGWRALATAGAFIHRLPVDQEFTLAAGRGIWGFPKIMADFTIRSGRRFGFAVRADGQAIVDLDFARGLPVPAPAIGRPRELLAYSHLDGVTRETPWRMRIAGLRVRPGGAALRLGDHPYAVELAGLGLPKRPMLTASVAQVAMTFGDAHPVG